MAKQMKTMTDSTGAEIPVKYVSAYDKMRDRVTRRIHARFEKARCLLETVVSESIIDLDELAKLKDSLGTKGNFSARSFDGLIQVAIRQQYNIRLDERVIRARELMMEYIGDVLDRAQGVDVSALRLLVQEAFKSNSQGFLSTGRVLALMRMEVNDAKWREAKMILQEALTPEKGKQYLICEARKTTQGDFKSIRLDIADCWPSPDKSPKGV
jgi:hypothetical protein